jgi:hypothetical protein
MKKTIIVISLFLASCGGSETTQTIEATYADTPKADSSVILPKLIEDTTTPVNKDTLTAQ